MNGSVQCVSRTWKMSDAELPRCDVEEECVEAVSTTAVDKLDFLFQLLV